MHGLVVIGLMTAFAGCAVLPALAGPLSIRGEDAVLRWSARLPYEGRLDAELPQTATITARDGSVLAEIDDIRFGRRRWVPLDQMALEMMLATVAAEDRRFYEHPGVDPRGLGRAVLQNAESGTASSGASTLEMQLVRNLYLSDQRTEQTITRKLTEAVTAIRLGERYSKDELLETYLNTVYYGNRTYGVEAAAQGYFGKPASDLNLAEAALLAGLPQSPSAYDPLQHPELARARQGYVLDQMVEAGYITDVQAAEARATPVQFNPRSAPPTRSPHWVNYIRDVVRQRFGPEALFTDGLQIRTTLDPTVQAMAERIVAQNEAVRQLAHANNSAVVVIDVPTGEVRAMVGSKDFYNQSIDGQVNVAVAGRQPGSSIKPLVYLAGFEHGLNPAVEVVDQVTAFPAPPGQPPYTPANWENKYYGRVTLRDALGNSLNVPAVKVLKYVGVPALKELARRLSITTLDEWDPRWLSLTLGGGEVQMLELVGAYATIARLGQQLAVEPFLSIETARGETVYKPGPDRAQRDVVDPRLAYQLLHVMGDAGARQVTFGPNSPLNLDRPHMVKTGTTDDYRDTWTIGCLPQVCVGVWMGNTENSPMVKVSSSLTAGKIWLETTQALVEHHGWEPVPFERPDGVVAVRVPSTGGGRPGGGDREEIFLPGQERGFPLEMPWGQP